MAEIDRYQAMSIRSGPGVDAAVVAQDGVVGPDGQLATIMPADVERIAKALYRAAGLGEPIILDRRTELTVRQAADIDHADGCVYLHDLDGKYDPEIAIAVATAIAVAAEAAASEPSEADVENLALALRDASRGTPPQEAVGWSQALARSLLRTHTVTPRAD